MSGVTLWVCYLQCKKKKKKTEVEGYVSSMQWSGFHAKHNAVNIKSPQSDHCLPYRLQRWNFIVHEAFKNTQDEFKNGEFIFGSCGLQRGEKSNWINDENTMANVCNALIRKFSLN